MAKHKMVSLALKEDKNTDHIGSDHDDGPKFGFGTSLHFNTEHVKALFGDSMPKAGEKFAINGMAFVDAISVNQDEGGDVNRSVGLQFTDMELLPPPAEEKDRLLKFDSGEQGS